MEAPDVRAFTRVFADRFEADDPDAAPNSSKEFASTSFAPSSRRSAGGTWQASLN